MAETKSTTLTVSILPAMKKGLREMAGQERRSLANMIEVMIRDHCIREWVAIPDQKATRFNSRDK
jgi:hypothetical protein